MKLIFDTETTGFPERGYMGLLPSPRYYPKYNSARLIELAYIIIDENNLEIKRYETLVKTGSKIPNTEIHGITDEMCASGREVKEVIGDFLVDLGKADTIIGHNLEFDLSIIQAEWFRQNHNGKFPVDLESKNFYCTMLNAQTLLKLKKYPKLSELCAIYFPEDGEYKGHRAMKDAEATRRCYLAMVGEKRE